MNDREFNAALSSLGKQFKAVIGPELRKRECYTPPGERRRKKKRKAIQRQRKHQRKAYERSWRGNYRTVGICILKRDSANN